ncbi:MAG TPA: methyltransferase domain-containing protein [Anaeromyxobacter sp.]|nr:methyltransferase domain-containing protein [Anaeromyxobacter sp.]
MSRRAGISPEDDRRWVFNRLEEDYRARPAYPAALVDRLTVLAGGPGARVADLGAGVGHLAVPLAARGLRVAAVEPARAMLAALSEAAGTASVEVDPAHAAAEATGLPDRSFALVVIADALQWIDPEAGAAEVRRLLAPGGVLAVVTARPAGTPFLDALGTRIAARNPKARPHPPPVALFFSLAGLPPPCVEAIDDPELPLDPAALEAVLRSLSYVGPALGPASLATLLEEARALAAEHGGATWRRELRVAWARGGSSPTTLERSRTPSRIARRRGPTPRSAARHQRVK